MTNIKSQSLTNVSLLGRTLGSTAFQDTHETVHLELPDTYVNATTKKKNITQAT